MWWLPAALAALPVDEGLRPPRHARAVVAAPDTFSDLDAAKRAVRVWWDQADRPGVVEAELAGRWKVVARGEPGLTTRALPSGTRVRVRLEGGVPSEPIVPWSALGPGDLARLQEGLPGPVVADIAPVRGGAWAALLEGGLALVDQDDLAVASLGRLDGLPAAGVNVVAVEGDRLWVGTERGLALLVDDEVQRVFDAGDGLPDDWVQALRPSDDGLWVGTYRGLGHLRGDAVERVLEPWSVFWIGTGADQRTWVAYEGLRGLPEGEPIEGVGDDVKVWDLDLRPPRTYLATQGEGVLRLEEGVLSPFWQRGDGHVFAMHRDGSTLWAASDQGLAALSDTDGEQALWGRAHGLPSDQVYEVEPGPPGKLWVGTSRGLALAWPDEAIVVPWPLSPTASVGGVKAVLGDGGWALIGGDEGLAALGRLPRGWRDALALPGPIVSLEESGDTLWVVGEEHVWSVRRGRVHRVDLPDTAQAATLHGALHVGTRNGLLRYEARADRFVPVAELGSVTQLASDGNAIWAAAGQRVVRLSPGGEQRDYLQTGVPTALAPRSGGLWVGTARGVQLLDPESGEVASIAGTEAAIAALAGTLAVTDAGDIVHVSGGAALLGAEAAEGVGAVQGARVDRAGRTWVFGAAGALVVPRSSP